MLFLLLQLLLNSLGHLGEGVLDVGGRLGGSLQEDQVERSSELGGLIVLNLTLVNQIGLVSDQELVHILAGIAVNLLQPLLNVVEGLLVGDIVDDDDTMSSTVVGRGDGTVEGRVKGAKAKVFFGGGKGKWSERMPRERSQPQREPLSNTIKQRGSKSRRTGSALDQQYPKFAT